VFLGSVTLLTDTYGIRIVSYVCMLLIGMLLGAIVKSEERTLSTWSKKQLKGKI